MAKRAQDVPAPKRLHFVDGKDNTACRRSIHETISGKSTRSRQTFDADANKCPSCADELAGLGPRRQKQETVAQRMKRAPAKAKAENSGPKTYTVSEGPRPLKGRAHEEETIKRALAIGEHRDRWPEIVALKVGESLTLHGLSGTRGDNRTTIKRIT